MKRFLLALLTGALVALPAHAQTKRDTAFAAKAKVALDSIARDKTAPQYSRRNQTRLRSWVDSLLMGPAKPDSVIVLPPPPDTTTPPPPPPDTDSTSIAAPAELPRSVPSFTIPPATRTYTITSDLQRAIDTAKAGDELRLSGVFVGPFVLPAKACGGWITIRSVAEPPAPGTRVTPTTAAGFAKIVSTGSIAAIKTTNPTCGWRLLGVDVGCTATSASENYGCVWLGDGGWTGGGENQVSLAQVPQDIVLDRVYLHGTATANVRRCLYINSGRTIVRDSWLSDCHSQGGDSQAILGCNGPGPYLIENNYLEGGHENVLFGGCDPVTPDLIPSDITLRRNHIHKPLRWKGIWTVKNLVETKNVRRMLIEANVLEHSWMSGQAGMAVVLKSSTETCAGCTWEGTKDVTMRWNRIDGAHRGLNLQAIDASSAGTTASHTERVSVTDNLFANIGLANGIEPLDGWLMLLTHDLKDVRIARNTFAANAPGYGLVMYIAYGGGGQRLDIRDNILAGQSYYAIGGDNGLHTTALSNAYGTSWRFSGNIVSQVEGQFAALSPVGNTYLTSIGQVGLTSDFRSTNYPSKGVDVAELTRRTLGVVVAP